MATILAANNGLWSATGTWTGGVIPTTGDIVVANNRTVTVNVDPIVSQIRNDTTGGATTGGTFVLLSGVTLSADNFFGSTATSSCVIFNAAGIATISGIVNGNNTVNSQTNGTVRNANIGTLVINGTVIGPSASSTNATVINNNGTLIINGSVVGGTQTNDCIAVLQAIPSTGTIIVNGNITSSAAIAINIRGGTFIANSGTITGGINQSVVSCTSTTSGIINSDIVGPPGGALSPAFVFNSTGALIVNGQVRGGLTASLSTLQNASVGTITINNIVIGGVAGIGVQNLVAGTIIVNGTGIGGVAGVGILNSSTGSVVINGTAIGGSGAAGVSNSSTGSVFATLAKGNAYGIGSSGISHTVGISNASFGPCYVSGIEFGDRGACPVFGPVQFLNSLNNISVMYRPSGLSKKILLDVNNVSGLLPQTIDVRKNVVYNLGNNIGSLNMPSSGSVALGVAVDNTSGVAILSNPGQIWDYDTSNISGVNSIGNRLKNCSTVENLGTQLSNALSSITP